jgi:TRAP-type uncharacterized transport system substrate-binding protein
MRKLRNKNSLLKNVKIVKRTLIALAFALSLTSAYAEDFVVATGDFKGGSTYSAMYRQLAKACSSDALPLVENETKGSPQNVELLTSNQVNAAIVQTDLLSYFEQVDADKVKNIKTLFTLHPEELHFIARADTKKEGGFMGLGGKEVRFRSLADLRGRKVGAVGGSILSGRTVSAQSGIPFTLFDAGSNTALRQGLVEGKFDAILVVGGAPHALVSSLDTNFQILPIGDSEAKLLKAYKPTKVSYSNLNQSGIPTVMTQASFVTRTYRSTQMQNSLVQLRACFMKALPEIQDTRGSHAKCQLVDSSDKGIWPWYELPAAK